MGVVLGFAPWLVFWVLVGHAPVLVAVLVALAVAVAAVLSGRAKERPATFLAIGAVATFAILAAWTLVAGRPLAERWILALGNAGLLAVAVASVAIGRSVVRGFLAADQSAAVAHSALFDPVVVRMTRIWLAAFALTTVSSAIPPTVLGDATPLDTASPLAVTCSWVVPVGTLAVAGIASRVLPDRMLAGFDDVARKTSFVAFVDLEIDQLHYLAREHANREVGPHQEAYNVTVGAKGTPLLGDATRVSWPSTFKVRDRRS